MDSWAHRAVDPWALGPAAPTGPPGLWAQGPGSGRAWEGDQSGKDQVGTGPGLTQSPRSCPRPQPALSLIVGECFALGVEGSSEEQIFLV